MHFDVLFSDTKNVSSNWLYQDFGKVQEIKPRVDT